MNGFIMCRCSVQFYKFLWVNKSHHYCVTRNEAWTNAIRKKEKLWGFFVFLDLEPQANLKYTCKMNKNIHEDAGWLL